ncbi:phosphatidylinositol 4-kinase gamma-like protein [Rhynchospora pubera]|uniref:1-phosphatidylinositol 4-kinase n=1 Tax=Rhynchospora pubera TaxID=906938 RepID=A0AAV8EWH2_9POAL|nr:phosphatidylinositol 4-kinase gamma-like protein [Rhynchospora pubera]
MSFNFRSLLKAERPIGNPLNGERTISNTTNRRAPVGRRRVFVQTDTGCVLAIDLDRGDNAHTVKRRLQVALNVPTNDISLSFGDKILENDLTSVRGESPLLLTRNSMHRSCSTPCLNPSRARTDYDTRTVKNGEEGSRLVEILGFSSGRPAKLAKLVQDVLHAIKSGVDPVPVSSGLGGSYYFRGINGENLAIVKPTDEEPFAPNNPKGFVGKTLGEPGLKRSVRVGETGFREVAAYLLDHENFANVPPTALVKITHPIFHLNGDNHHKAFGNAGTCKIASLQQFVPHNYDASDYGTSGFPVSAVHRIGILDIRILNTDRHGGNVLVRNIYSGVGDFGGSAELLPIDHGLCLPETLEDPYFEWIHWPQASVAFSEEELKYISNLDPEKDCKLLQKEIPMIREACLRVLVLCTNFLKISAELGFSLSQIGAMMSREFKGSEEEPSELELICMEARGAISEQNTFLEGNDTNGEEASDFLFHMDVDENGGFGLPCPRSRSPLPKLDESFNEDEEEEAEEVDCKQARFVQNPYKLQSNVSNLSKSLNGVRLVEKMPLNPNPSGVNRSADENFPSSTCFVRLGDMGKQEWFSFIEKFNELVKETLTEKKSVGPPCQGPRLGSSCRF